MYNNPVMTKYTNHWLVVPNLKKNEVIKGGSVIVGKAIRLTTEEWARVKDAELAHQKSLPHCMRSASFEEGVAHAKLDKVMESICADHNVEVDKSKRGWCGTAAHYVYSITMSVSHAKWVGYEIVK